MPLRLLSSPAAAAKLAAGLRAAPLRRCHRFAPAPRHPDRVSLANSLTAAAAARSAGPAVAAAQNKLGGKRSFLSLYFIYGEILSVSGKKQVLISLSDKTDLAYLGNGLQGLGYSIVSTGGTASSLEAAGVNVTKVEEITHFPEMLDGRVKTLHPSIHGGILARRDQEHHLKALKDHGIGTFDVVVVNLYPFYDKVTSGTISFEDGIENIDIGGPTMIRAAAKNHKDVLIVVDHNDYPALLEYLKGNQEDQQFRRMLAWKAFQHVASYDSAVSEWLWKQSNKGEMFPPSFTVPLELKSTLRYGENPHQNAAFYADKSLSLVSAGGIATAIQHHGKVRFCMTSFSYSSSEAIGKFYSLYLNILKSFKQNIPLQEMSYNNYLDADAAWNCVSEFDSPTCVVVKHTNPCGVASRQDILEAYRLAVRGDPVSAFGGIVAFNTTIDEDLAKEIREFRSPTDGQTRMFYEIVVAPGYTEKGLEILQGKSKTLRILEAKRSGKGMLSLRQVNGGWLAQESDDLAPEDITFTTGSERAPQEIELADAKFAWLCAKHVKSNAIVIAKNNCMLGMGSGQPNRRESLRIAFRKAGEEAKGAALASDAFFPFGEKQHDLFPFYIPLDYLVRR
ncbi:Bifunctional purine biosynthesis protein PurH [Dichanthelium oligosanthes]|uniref:Bifunctional purine biosynthesis protein PurH n=1 Tax=Dichanthelium oligosanthes TaxID=888268 RepID=A0A1E5V6N7_9POAL|nr:Bifunctional purine biosynthesis protein PurH [Dichanthelium oligosanthes]